MPHEHAGRHSAATIIPHEYVGRHSAATITPHECVGRHSAATITPHEHVGRHSAATIIPHEHAGRHSAATIMVDGNAGDTVAEAIMVDGNAGDTVAGTLWTEAAPPEPLFPRWRLSPLGLLSHPKTPNPRHSLISYAGDSSLMYGRTPGPTHTIGTRALLHDHLMDGTILQGDHVRTATHRDRRVAFGQVNALH